MEAQSDATEKRILEATIEQIRTAGYEAVSLRKIASQVGLTTGAFYKRFKNKDELFAEVTQVLSASLAEEMTHTVSSIKEPKDQLLKIAELLVAQFQKNSHTMYFLFFNTTAQEGFSDVSAGEAFPFFRLVADTIANLPKSSNDLDANQRFIQLWSFIQGYGLLIINRVTEYDPLLVKTTLESILKG